MHKDHTKDSANNDLLTVEHLETHFTSRGGLVKAVDDVSFSLRPRPDHGAGRRIRLGQNR